MPNTNDLNSVINDFHNFTKIYEFLLHWHGFENSLPLFFNTDTIISSDDQPPTYVRLIPVSDSDPNAGYHLSYNGLYARYSSSMYGNSTCVATTSNINEALTFKPEFVSATEFRLGVPGYNDPNIPDKGWNQPSVSYLTRRTGYGGVSATLMIGGYFNGFETNFIIPTVANGARNFQDAAASQKAKIQKYHHFFSNYEFTISYTTGQPLNWQGNALTAQSPAQAFQLIPADYNDASKGYYLFSGGQYVSKSPTYLGSSDCTAGTTDIHNAILFKPTFLTETTFRLDAPGYVFPYFRAPHTPFYVLGRRWSGGPETIMVQVPNWGGFLTDMNIPTDGNPIGDLRKLLEKWDRFFAIGQFPLIFTTKDLNQVTLSSDNQFLIPEPNNAAVLTHFQFISVDANDFTKGYRIKVRDHYISSVIRTYNGISCLTVDADIHNADIFKPDFTSDNTLRIKRVSDKKVLTRIWVNGTGQIAITIADLSDSIDMQQVFEIPRYAFRQARIDNLATNINFLLQVTHDGPGIFASSNSTLAFGEQSAFPSASSNNPLSSGIILFSLPEPNSYHSGYHISVGGKWIKEGIGLNQDIPLTDNIDQAEHFCPIFHNTNLVAFWVYDSNKFLGVNQSNEVRYFELENNASSPFVWFVEFGESHRHDHLMRLESTTTTYTIDSTRFLKPIVQALNDQGYSSSLNSLWNLSFDNQFSSEWLLSSPGHGFELPYSSIPQRITDGNNPPLGLKSCSTSAQDPHHPCIDLTSSVTSINTSIPAGQIKSYNAGHSYFLYEAIYELITSAEHIIDIASILAPPSGEFKLAIKNALTFLATKPSAKDVIVRILLGRPGAGIPGAPSYQSAIDFIKELVDDAAIKATDSRMKIYVVFPGARLVWNHAKIVAIDGKECIVGGHNWWDGDYLAENPVFDVSMRVSGHAAIDAHRFCEDLWLSAKDNAGGQNAMYSPKGTFDQFGQSPGNFLASDPNAFPLPRAFKSFLDTAEMAVNRSSGNGVPILAIGRRETQGLDFAPSDLAIISLINQAESSIYFSLQKVIGNNKDGILPRSWTIPIWWDGILNAIARKLEGNAPNFDRGFVTVTIFMSNPAGGSYFGTKPEDVEKLIADRMTRISSAIKYTRLANNLKIRSFPLAETKWGLSPGTEGIRNHAKVILVDHSAYLIGSQNIYPTHGTYLGKDVGAYLAEFGFIVEDLNSNQLLNTAARLYNEYFKKLEEWADAAVSPPPSPVEKIYSYTVTIQRLTCVSTSDDGALVIIGVYAEDNAYLSLNTKSNKIWPDQYKAHWWSSTLSYYDMMIDQSRDITDHNGNSIVLPTVKVGDNPVTVQLYEWDFLGDDHLLDWSFHPEQEIHFDDSENKKLKDLNPNTTYRAIATESHTRYGSYWLYFSFTKTEINP